MNPPFQAPGFVFTEEYWYTSGGLPTKKRFYLMAPSRSYSSIPIDLNYGYNTEGQMTTTNLFDGSSYVYTRGYTYDDLARLSGMTGTPSVTNVSYNVADQMTSITHNGLAETRQYDSLFQLTRITIPGQMDLEYRYSASANNGQITQMKNWISGEEVNYGYDAVGRLSTAITTGPEWGLSFTYDGFGNKTAQTVTKGTAPAMSVGIDANNRVVGWTYDNAGFPTAVAGQFTAMSWDAQGRMQGINVQGGNVDNFVYDPSNHRVWRNNQLHLRGIDGKVAALFNFNTSTETFSLATTYAWFAGRKVGQKIDRLGTVQNGSRFYPYGEESASTANDTDKFATYWRDSNSGLDYAVNRYYRASVGRFMSPDPYWGSATMVRSGSWNRYAYVEGDPVNGNDPNGLSSYYYYMNVWLPAQASAIAGSGDADSPSEGAIPSTAEVYGVSASVTPAPAAPTVAPAVPTEPAVEAVAPTVPVEMLEAQSSDVSLADMQSCALDGVPIQCSIVQGSQGVGVLAGGDPYVPPPSAGGKQPRGHGAVTQVKITYQNGDQTTQVTYKPVSSSPAWTFGISFYAGFGGGFTVTYARGMGVCLGGSLGVGVGRWGPSFGNIEGNDGGVGTGDWLSGWSIGAAAAAPIGIQATHDLFTGNLTGFGYLFSTPGMSVSIGYTGCTFP